MTNEELRQKYRLMQLVAEHGVRSYHALDGAGHLCMVHYLPGASPETAQLVALLDALGPRDQPRILERMQVDGAPVVITQLIPGFASLATWLETRTPRPDAGPPAPAASRGAGEFTQLFGPSSGEKAAPAQAQPHTPAPPRAAPGGADATPALPLQPSPDPPDEKPSIRWRDKPESSDRPVVRWKESGGAAPRPSLAAPPTPPIPEPPVKPAPGRQPPKSAGELTQLFGAAGGEGLDHPAPPSPAPESLPVADPWGSGRRASPSGPPPPGISPGEFTRLFQPEKGLGVPSASALERGSRDFAQAPEVPPPPAAAAPPPPAPSQPPGEFTRLMGVGPVGGQPGASAAPGEFTRMIAGAPASPLAPVLPTPPAAPVAGSVQRSPRLVVLVLALGFVVIAALALVLYFALK